VLAEEFENCDHVRGLDGALEVHGPVTAGHLARPGALVVGRVLEPDGEAARSSVARISSAVAWPDRLTKGSDQ
jgi:hypothetical protein